MELLQKLGIDSKLLIAQIVNFAILLFILAKFVYKPVLETLEKRSKTIEKGLKDARESEEKLRDIEKLHDEKILQAEREIGQLMDKARSDAEVMKKELAAAAQLQAEDLLRRAEVQMREEKAKMLEDIKREVTAVVVTATGKLLQREFSSADQKRLVNALSREMQSIK